MVHRHARRRPVIRALKYAGAIVLGTINVVLFGQTFVSAVGWHIRPGTGLTPGQVALVSVAPLEYLVLCLAVVSSWRSDNGTGPTRQLCWTLGGECALNWAIFILGGGLVFLSLGI